MTPSGATQPCAQDRESYARVLMGLARARGDREVVIRAVGDDSATLRIEWPGCGNALEILDGFAATAEDHGFTAVGYHRIELDNGDRQYSIDCPAQDPSSARAFDGGDLCR